MIGLDPLEPDRLVVHTPKGPEIAFPRHQRIDVEIDEGNGTRPKNPGHERRLARSPPAREKERTASLFFHPSKVFEKPGGRFVSVGKENAHDDALVERTTSL